MTFDEILERVLDLLRREGRVSYRALMLRFNLDSDYMEALKDEIIKAKQVARDEEGVVLVWTGAPEAASPPVSSPAPTQERSPLSYTPHHLATKILTSRSALTGERKQVTVLFCDLANSTSLAARVGPETMHALLNQFFEWALSEVHRYEGTINQFLGDGFMALFGAPIAHEDHARRAVLAALGLQRRLHAERSDLRAQYGVDLAMRVGLNTGLVVVGAIGDNLRMDYTAVGDTANLAVRLQQTADLGQIVLSEATHRLVAGYCVTHPLGALTLKGKDEPLEALIVQKAEGNPFFVEEVVKSLQEVGAIRRTEDRYILAKPLEEVVVPDTIQDVLMARIDRLQEAPKRTLQLAAVIGREFTHRLLDRLADIRERTEVYLQELKAIELIYEKRLFPELAYMFKHALTQDVAYNSLLMQRRQELHCLIGLAIEELYADRLAEQYEVLAYHFVKGAEWARAFAYLLKAAEKATNAFAIREAVALYDQALEVASQLGDVVDAQTLIAMHQAQAHLYSVLSDFQRSRAEGERALHLARQAEDRGSEAAALAGMGWASMWTYEFDRALAYACQAIEVAEAANAKAVLAGAHFTSGFVYGVTARLEQSREENAQALTISQSTGNSMHESLALGWAGQLKNWEGECAEASHLTAEALHLAREHSLLAPHLFACFWHGLALTGKGDYDEARTTFEEGLALSEKVGDVVMHHRLLNCFGWLYLELGDLERALEFNQQGAEGARKRGDAETIANPGSTWAISSWRRAIWPWRRRVSTGSIALCTIRRPVPGCGGATPPTSSRAWENSGWPTESSPRRRSLLTSAWSSQRVPTHGSISSRGGGSRGRWPSPVTSGTTQRGGCGRP